jgi:Helix-turn-helix domain
VWWWTCWRIVRLRPPPTGSRTIPTWGWSAATAGLYAEAARESAPQAKQVAYRFHSLQNFRETIECQLGGYEAPIRECQINAIDNHAATPVPAQSDCASDAVTLTRFVRHERPATRQKLFDEIRALFEGGSSIGEIARKLGVGRRRVERWVRRIDLPDRNTMASTPSNPAYFGVLLERLWTEGITKVRHLFAEMRNRGPSVILRVVVQTL